MARIRTIKPEFWTSEQVVDCSPIARLLFIGLWNFSDDQGAHPYAVKTIKMEIFPGDNFTPKQIEGWLTELINAGLLKTYHVDNKQYLYVTGWHNQKIEKPNPKHPPPQQFDDNSTTPQLPVGDSSPPEGKGREGSLREGRVGKAKTSLPPEFEISNSVKEWAARRGYINLGEHLEAFKAKCLAKGYRYVDWDAAFKEAVRENWARVGTINNQGKQREVMISL